MSELPDLPPAPRRPLLPTEVGLARVVAGGRSRRLVALGTGGSATAVAVVVALLLGSGGPARPDSLQPAGDPDPVVSAAQGLVREVPTATPTAEPSSGSTAAPSPEPEPEPTSSDDPGAAAPPDGGEQREEPTDPPAFTESPREVAAPVSCRSVPDDSGASFDGGGLCTEAYGLGDGRYASGAEVAAVFAVCVSHRAGEVELGFASGQEHEVVVRAGTDAKGPVVYRFSQAVTYPQGAHSRTLAPGRCLQWRGAWDQTIDGELAPPGRYTVQVSAVPSAIDGRPLEPGAAGSITVDAHVLAEGEDPDAPEPQEVPDDPEPTPEP